MNPPAGSFIFLSYFQEPVRTAVSGIIPKLLGLQIYYQTLELTSSSFPGFRISIRNELGSGLHEHYSLDPSAGRRDSPEHEKITPRQRRTREEPAEEIERKIAAGSVISVLLWESRHLRDLTNHQPALNGIFWAFQWSSGDKEGKSSTAPQNKRWADMEVPSESFHRSS